MGRVLRILNLMQFSYPDSFGGVERVAYETLKRLVERGHLIDSVVQRTREGAPDVEELHGVTLHRYGGSSMRGRRGGNTIDALLSSRRVIRELLDTKPFDLVTSHHHFPYHAYQKVARQKVLPEVMTFHASFWQELKLEGANRHIGKPLESLFFGGLARRTEVAGLRRADSVIVLSDFSREQVRSYYPFAAEKVVKIRGGVDLERFRPAPDRAAVRRALDLPPGRPVLFTARRLVPRMGLENLLTGVGQVARSFPDVLLVIAGRGRLREKLGRRAEALGLGGAVRFAGYVDDATLVEYYQVADLFVLPSLAFEGFGMVTLEALACGTPVVGTPIGATPEILRPLAPQLLFDGTEPSALRRGILIMLEWLSGEVAATKLRARCRAYVEDEYGWDPAIDALESVFRRVMG